MGSLFPILCLLLHAGTHSAIVVNALTGPDMGYPAPTPPVPCPALPQHQGNGAPYLAAARHGDVLALRTLVSLRCPWGRPGRVFARAIWARKGTVSMWHLQMLLSFGCPVVWCSALSAAKLRAEPEVEVWLRGLWEGGRRAAAKRRAGRLIFDL